MINRTQQPAISQVKEIHFVAPETRKINGSIPVYLMRDVQNETSRLDLYFDAGKNSGDKGISSFVNGLLLSGTPDRNSVEINEAIDSLGGFFQSGVSMENAVISMYALREFLPEIMNGLTDALKNVHFDEKETTEYLADRKQKHLQSMGKVSYLSQREFQKHLFQSNELYASVMELEDLENVSRKDLIDFHQKHYLNGLQKVVLVGDFSDQEIDQILTLLEGFSDKNLSQKDADISHEKGRFHVSKEGALQTAVRVGRILFNKKHEDYLDFLVLNTILGDYFGSRLMSNIREDKGYTYGIGSMVNEFENTGYFMIGTEVKKEVTEDTLVEIKFELDRLQNELVNEGELELVKNYLLGQLLKSADGPYAMMDLYLSADMQGKDLEYYNDAMAAVRKINPERIQQLARLYLNWDDLTVVTAG
ncbi:MAG: M16 family metallopeptidase [Crocinitomicaceae bacterium]